MKTPQPISTEMSRSYLLKLCAAASPSGKLVVGSWVWNNTADDWVIPISCEQCGTVYKAMASTIKDVILHSLQEYIKTHAHPINATSVLKMDEWNKQKSAKPILIAKPVPINQWKMLPLQKDPAAIVQNKLEQMAKGLGLTVDELLAQIKGEKEKKNKPPVVEQSAPKIAPEKKGRKIR